MKLSSPVSISHRVSGAQARLRAFVEGAQPRLRRTANKLLLPYERFDNKTQRLLEHVCHVVAKILFLREGTTEDALNDSP
jgi:hypothetical protein